ncbi:hypothetical protein HZH66_011017 [Vespula vulgaris]|uniref:Uncharacterized protein n=1 Tax=Vespula vulgaris TaxID=7454 RepID=A0A834MVB4_VESVU|nr:hypothetical protein HZH66_011017 [Vespula vulgaris]
MGGGVELSIPISVPDPVFLRAPAQRLALSRRVCQETVEPFIRLPRFFASTYSRGDAIDTERLMSAVASWSCGIPCEFND